MVFHRPAQFCNFAISLTLLNFSSATLLDLAEVIVEVRGHSNARQVGADAATRCVGMQSGHGETHQ